MSELERRLARGADGPAMDADRLFVAAILGLLAVLLVASMVIAYFILAWLVEAIRSATP